MTGKYLETASPVALANNARMRSVCCTASDCSFFKRSSGERTASKTRGCAAGVLAEKAHHLLTRRHEFVRQGIYSIPGLKTRALHPHLEY